MNARKVQSLSLRGPWVRVLLGLALLLGAWPALSPAPALAFPAPVQIYYLTLPEANALTVLNGINTDAVSPMYTYFSIAIAVNDTYVYYDQWEDGYAVDIANPTPAEIYGATNLDGVQVWGNGEADDGCAPNIAGTPVTCTDANDVLHAGDVIIPYNSIDIPRAATAQNNALDQFAVVAYNNNDGNTNWSSDWVETGDYLTGNYRDEFATVAYNNSNGSLSWTGQSWTEVGDDGAPNAGYTLITNAMLRFNRYSALNDAIWRQADLSGYSAATLSFTLNGNSIDGANDAIAVQASGNGGGAWTTLQTFTSDPNGATYTYDVTGYIAADFRVRFIMTGNDLVDFNEYWEIDNVDITVAGGDGTSPSAGDIQVTGGALRFTATETGDAIDRGVSLPAGDSCATLSFTLGQNAIDLNEDRLAVQVSADGATYSTLETFDAAADAGAKTYNISAYATANTRVRFLSVDPLEAGEYWSFDNVQVSWNCTFPIRFDARDKIGATNSIAMARAAWATGSGTLNAFAHEMYPANEWGTVYESPVGTNTANAGAMFEYSALSIMAAQDNTTVQVDANADGTLETSATLNQGEATLVTGIAQGARVESNRPVQVVLVTGDVGSNYESRDMNLLPVSSYGNSYWSPVGTSTGNGGTTPGPTRLFLYNPSTNGAMTFTCTGRGGTSTSGSIAARGGWTFDLTDNQAAHCTASGPFFAVGTIDTDGQAWDWSFTLFPDNFMTTDALVGLGLGKDPTNTTSTQDGSPLWVTPACAEGTYVYVDWGNDGVADLVDLNGDGDTADTVDGIAEGTSANGLLVPQLYSVRLYEPGLDEEEYDQSGARVWSRTEAGVGYGGTPGCSLAVAWGQDTRVASAGSPGLDVGTSVPPLRLVEATKTLELLMDNDGDGILSPGDGARYTMTVRNSGPAVVPNVYIHDTVPANMAYSPNTTRWNLDGGAWNAIPDDNPSAPGFDGTVYPLDVPNGILLGSLTSGHMFYITFDVVLNGGYTYSQVQNCDVAYTGAGNLYRCATNLVAVYDWGDLPDSYGTAFAADGPRHSASALRLGAWFDRELEGQPVANAAGDDDAETTMPKDDDEDGVANAATPEGWWAGRGAFNVTVTGGSGCLNGWMDFTNDAGDYLPNPPHTDGNFRHAGVYDSVTYQSITYSEHIIQNLVLAAGAHNVPVSVPPELNTGTTTQFYFRFRLSPEPCGTIAPTGFVDGGEVEDYLFDLGSPTAVRLIRFEAESQAGGILLTWETATEIDNAGFNLYRAASPTADPMQLNAELIPSYNPGDPSGHVYTQLDASAAPNVLYYYWLDDVDLQGVATRHGPVPGVFAPNGFFYSYLPLIAK